MKQKHLLIASFLCLLMLGSAMTYSILRDEDSYLGYTGLGDSIELTDDDRKLYFSYYLDGSESIYRANSDGSNVEKLTNAVGYRHRRPALSPDGEKLLYVSENEDSIQSLYVANADGTKEKKITDNDIQVQEAVFSQENTIYYVAMPAEAVHKAEGETQEGFDLHVVDLDGKNEKKLTDEDHFTMKHLSISEDGSQIYYTLFNGNSDQVYSYHVKKESESLVNWDVDGHSFNDWNYNEDANAIVYTDVSEQSKESSLFKYELFYTDLGDDQTKQLTNLQSSIVSPEFFHQSNQIAFLEYTNWASDPAEYTVKSVDPETKKIREIKLDLPESNNNHWFRKTLSVVTSSTAIAVLYTLLLGFLTLYYQKKSGKRYRVGIISLILTGLIFLSSILIATMSNPWAGIAIGMIAFGMLPCSIIALVIGFIAGKLAKRTD